MFARTCSRFLLPCLIAVPASAADFYVDVANGNDTNAGTSPATAWKSLAHASQLALPGSSTTVHVAPGVYSPASGELYPLRFHGQVLLGDEGPDVTILDGGGSANLIEMTSLTTGALYGLTRVEGLGLRNAQTGILVTSGWLLVSTTVVNCHLSALMQGIGGAAATPQGAGASLSLTLQGVTLDNCDYGISTYTNTQLTLTASDCTVRGGALKGIELTSHAYGYLLATLTRCRVENTVGEGISTDVGSYGNISVSLDGCLVARNGGGFVDLSAISQVGGVAANIRRCTIADNAGPGVRVLSGQSTGGGLWGYGDLYSSLIHGNNGDLDVADLHSNVSCQISGPDPLFVDPLNGDYHLRFGSPCIDSSDPNMAPGVVDLDGTARLIDGNLNAHERADVGAYEFMPLRLVSTGQIGSPLRLEMAGQTGGMTTVYFARSMPVPPMSTPFGEFDLNPATYGTLLHSNVAPFPPIAFQRPIPNNAFLVGHTFSFQALTTSSVAPQGSAYTNVVSFIVLP